MPVKRTLGYGVLVLALAGALVYGFGPAEWRKAVDGAAANLARLTGLAKSSPSAEAASDSAQPGAQGGGQGGGSGRGPKGGDRKVSVVTAVVDQTAMPYEYASVGTIQTTASVTVRSRVDATILKVAVTDGDQVTEGDVLIELDRSALEAQIAQAEAVLAKDQAQIDKAERDLERARRLISAKAGTKVTEEEAKTALAVAEATLKADQAAVATLEVQRSYYTLKAPIGGRLGVVAAQPGALVRAGDQLASIVAVDPVYVVLGVPQRYLADVVDARKDGTARLRVQIPGRSLALEGPITMIENEADATTGLVTVRAKLENPQSYVWPGEIVEARLVLRMQPDAVVIPNEAVQIGQQGETVFVVDEAGKARLRSISVDRTVGQKTIVATGLRVGERVVIDGQLQLTDGSATLETGRDGERKDAQGEAPAAAGTGG